MLSLKLILTAQVTFHHLKLQILSDVNSELPKLPPLLLNNEYRTDTSNGCNALLCLKKHGVIVYTLLLIHCY